MGIPTSRFPQDLLAKPMHRIVPGLKKGAFFVGAKYGKGFRQLPGAPAASAGPRLDQFGSRAGALASNSVGTETDAFML